MCRAGTQTVNVWISAVAQLPARRHKHATSRRRPTHHLAPDRMTAHIFGNRKQNSPPPHESTRPPTCSIASHRGSDARTISSASALSTRSAAWTAATTSCRDSAGKSFRGSITLEGNASTIGAGQRHRSSAEARPTRQKSEFQMTCRDSRALAAISR